jgi:hypothetical protein
MKGAHNPSTEYLPVYAQRRFKPNELSAGEKLASFWGSGQPIRSPFPFPEIKIAELV